jgi:hypothetical protein
VKEIARIVDSNGTIVNPEAIDQLRMVGKDFGWHKGTRYMTITEQQGLLVALRGIK